MARTDTLPHFLTDVADAIREKKGSEATITASNFDTEIENLPSGGGLDWSAIGYLDIPETIQKGYDYAKYLYDNWDSSITDTSSKYLNDTSLIYFPVVNTSNVTLMTGMFNGSSIEKLGLIDTSNVTNMQGLFYNCRNLKEIPVLDTRNVTTMRNIIYYCYLLTDTSIDNLLQMCINAISYTDSKSLSQLGFSSSGISSSRIQALPHYQDFINAGWTI